MVPPTRVLAIVQAGGKGSRLDVLTRERAKPALPFAGSFKLIDVALSNLANSGIGDVWLSVQYQAGSLHHHLAAGRPWDLDRTRGGLRWLMPEEGGGSIAQDGFSNGNGDDLARFSDSIRAFHADAVVVMSTDQVLALDLRTVIATHLERGSACTIVTTEVSPEQAAEKAVIGVGDDARVTSVDYKPEGTSATTISAEVFVYDPAALLAALDALRAENSGGDDGSTGIGDFGEHLLPRLVRDREVHAWPLEGYWADLGTPASYLAAHRDLLAERVADFSHDDWPMLTRWPELPAARVDTGAVLDDVVLSAGCRVRGTVRRSVLGPGVVVEEGAVVEDAVLFWGVHVAGGARVTTAIIDDEVEVRAGASVGQPTRGARAHDDQIAVVGRQSVVGAGVVVPAGGRLEPGTTA